jgi:hypothetical protein
LNRERKLTEQRTLETFEGDILEIKKNSHGPYRLATQLVTPKGYGSFRRHVRLRGFHA